MILYIYNVYGQQMISIDLGVVRSKVKVTRADSFSTVSGLKVKGFSSLYIKELISLSIIIILYQKCMTIILKLLNYTKYSSF